MQPDNTPLQVVVGAVDAIVAATIALEQPQPAPVPTAPASPESPEAPAQAPNRLCKIADVLKPSELAIVTASPRNEVVRGIILARTGLWLPPECQTLESITEFIETRYTGPKLALAPSEPGRTGIDAAHNRRTETAIEISVRYTYTEQGRCSYTRDYSASGNISLTVEEIERCLHDAGTWRDVVDYAREIVEDGARELDAECTDESNDDYSDGETTESDVNIRSDLEDELMTYIREHYPEQAEELGLSN